MVTIDPREVRRWLEALGGYPGIEPGTLRLLIDFGGYGASEGKLEPIAWEEFERELYKRRMALDHLPDPDPGEAARSTRLITL